VSYNYLAQSRTAGLWFAGNDEVDLMGANQNGVSAGIVAGADIYSQSSQPSAMSASLGNPATWSYIWVGIAVMYLVGIYVGAIRIAGRGE
jgi:hypothetical protein